VILSVILPVLAFQGVNLAQSWETVLQCQGQYLLVGGGFFMLTLAVRSWRWHRMLAVHQPLAYRACLSATCVGYLANNVLPLRLSDLVRVGALRQLTGVSGSRSLGTVVIERVLDILTLDVFLGVYLILAAGGEHRSELLTAAGLALAGGLALVVVLALGYRWRHWFAWLAGAPVGCLHPSLGKRVSQMMGLILEGFQVFASPLQALRLLAMSAGLWGAAVGSYACVGAALHLGLGPLDFMVVVFAGAMGAIIPAAPGAVGTFHGFARLGLYLVGVHSAEQALAFAAVLHAWEWMLINVTGLYFLVADRLSLAASASAEEKEAAPSTSYSAVLAVNDAQSL
jgi:uncharacterized protein (TIRG00374 family)